MNTTEPNLELQSHLIELIELQANNNTTHRDSIINKLSKAINDMSIDPDNDKATITMAKVQMIKTYADLLNDTENSKDKIVKSIQKQNDTDHSGNGDMLKQFVKELGNGNVTIQFNGNDNDTEDNSAKLSDEEIDQELDQILDNNNITVNENETKTDSKDLNIEEIIGT